MLRGIKVERQVICPIEYRGLTLDEGYRLDLLVEDSIIVELKAVDALNDVHTAQLLTYLKLTGIELGLLINFNVTLLKNGIRRLTIANSNKPSVHSVPSVV
jgi:GxxExxY protein